MLNKQYTLIFLFPIFFLIQTKTINKYIDIKKAYLLMQYRLVIAEIKST